MSLSQRLLTLIFMHSIAHARIYVQWEQNNNYKVLNLGVEVADVFRAFALDVWVVPAWVQTL